MGTLDVELETNGNWVSVELNLSTRLKVIKLIHSNVV